MEEKRRFATGACGKASILLAGALNGRCVFAAALLIAAAAAIQLAGGELFQSAFADTDISPAQMPPGNSYHRSISESMSVTSTHGGSPNAPVSHYRSMSESMAVTSIHGKAPASYSRSMSEQASVTTGMPPAPAGPQLRAAPAPATPYSASSNQRIDERLSPSLKHLSKRGDMDSRSAIGGTSILATEFLGSMQAGSPDQFSETGEISEDASPDDSSSSLLHQLDNFNEYMRIQKSIENAALANLSTSAVLLFGAVTVVVAKQPAVSGGRLQKRVHAIFLLKHSVVVDGDAAQKIRNAPVSHALLLVIVVFAVSPVAVSIGSSSAQEYGGSPSKALIEILAANHLDSDRRILGDIYEEVRELDGIWSEEIPGGHYVRVTFEQGLTSARDITVHTRVVSGEPRIEVYEKDGTELIAEFTHLSSNENNKVFLTSLQGSQDTFDLRVLGGSVEFDHIVDPWPIPTYVGAGSPDSGGGGNVTPTLPAGLQNGDILLLFIETRAQTVTVDTPNGGTWTEVADSPQSFDGTNAEDTQLTVFWSRYNGSQGDPSLSDSGDHNLAVILAFRGVIATGDPWDVTSGSVEGSDTSLSATGDTTMAANTLVVVAAALNDDNDTFGATWTNADLANIAVRVDVDATAGNDGRLGIITGEKATAGSYGVTTNTLSAGGGSTKAMMTIALKPPLPVPPTLSISQPDGTGDTVTRGDPFSITYTLSDPDDVTTAAFFFDTNNSGLDGTAISGACATAAEGTNVTCQWDTTNMTPGSYYVYGIANDGANPAVSAYSPGQITINPVNNLRNLSEQLAVEDVVARLAVQAITMTDQLSVADTIQTESPNGASKSITEQAGISESINPAQVLSRSVAEQLAAGDSIVGSLSFSAPMTDQVAVSDSIEFDHVVDPTPTYVGAGTFAESAGPITPTLPSGVQTDDILLLFIETRNQGITISNPNGGTWTEVADSPQSFDGTNAEDTRLTVFWSRHDGSQGDPTLSDSGNHNLAVILAFRGVIATGDPWDVTSGSVEGSDTSLSATGDTTTVENTLVVIAAALAVDAANFGGTWTNADLASVTERTDVSTALGNTGRLGIVTGQKATASAYGATTNTLTAAAEKAMMTIALRPPVPPTLSISQPDGTGDTVTRGDPFSITYTLSDPDDVTTAAFFFDTNNSGLDGTAISGACATAAEGTSVTCQWDTTGMAPGSYYVYGIANDGANPAVSAYSPGQITINPAVNSRGLAEQAGISESINPAQVLSRSVAEQLAAGDSIVGSLSFSAPMTDQVAVSDSIQADAVTNVQVSITEQMDLQDRIRRALNGYSAGTVYRSDTGEFGLDSVKYRQWDPTASIWSPEVELPDTGSEIRDAKILFSPVSEMRVVISHGADGTLNLFRCDAVCIDEGSWTLEEADFADTHDNIASPDPSKPFRHFDAAFKQQSGDLLIVYDRDQTENLDFYYRTWDGATLSPVSGFDLQNLAGVQDVELISYFHMAAKPNSNEIAMALIDYTKQDAHALIFDATTGTPSMATKRTLTTSMGSTSIDGDSVGIAYEPGNAGAAAFAANGADSIAYATWNGAAWSSVSTVDPNTGSAGNDIRFMAVKASPDPSTNAMMVCQVDDLLDLTCAEMENGALGSFTLLDSDVDTGTSRPFDFVWIPGVDAGILVYGTASDVVNWQAWFNDSWTQFPATPFASTHPWIAGHEAPSTSEIGAALFLAMNNNLMIGSLAFTLVPSPALVSLGNASHTFDADTITTEGMGIDWQSAGIRQPFRLPAESMAVTDTVRIAVGKFASDSLAITESTRPTSVRPLSESLVASDAITKSPAKVLSEQLATSDAIVKVPPKSLMEQLGVAETIARTFISSRSASEQMAITESISKADARAAAEQLGLSDAIARTITISKSMTEQLAVSEAAAKAAPKSMSEQLALAEMIARSTVQSRGVAEQLAMTETVSGVPVKLMSDSLGLADTIARTVVTSRSATDQLTVVDVVTASTSKQMAEQLTLADNIQRSIVTARTMTEQMATAETISKAVSVALAEQLATADVVARNADQSVSLAEQMVIAEVVSKTAAKVLSEQITFTDAVAKSAVIARTASEQMTITETASKTSAAGLAEQMAVTEAADRTIVVSRSMSEQAAVSDAITVFAAKTLSEQMTMADAVAASSEIAREMTEQLTLADATLQSSPRQLAEQLAVQDTVARTLVLSRAASESLAVQEATAKAASATVTEQMAVAEQADRRITATRSISEQLVLSEATGKTVSSTLSESLAVSESIARATETTRSMSEQLAASEAIAKSASTSLAEQLVMADNLQRSADVTRAMSEQMGMTEMTAKAATRTLTEQADITDAIARTVVQSRSVTEQMNVDDTLNKAVATTLAEQLAIQDAAARSTGLTRTADESLLMQDAVSKAVSKTVMEQMAVSDESARNVTQSRSPSEQLGVNDALAPSIEKPLSESLGVTDDVQRLTVATRQLSEQMNVTDALAKSIAKTMTEQAGIADTIAGTATLARSMAETLAVQETITKSASVVMVEQLALVDTTARTTVQSAFVAEHLAATDAMSAAVEKSLTESLAVADTVARGVVQSRSVAEAMTVQDATAASSAKQLTETMAVTDAVATSSTASRPASDQMTIDDMVSIAVSKSMSEQLALAEAAARTGSQSRSVADQMAVTETVVKSAVVEMTEQLGVAETAARSTAQDASIAEQLGMSESISISILKMLADGLSASDAIIPIVPGAASESLSIAESISAAVTKPVSDQLGVLDSITISMAVSVAEQMTVSDSMAATAAGEVFVSDQLGATESIAIKVFKQVADGLAISDSVMISGSNGMAESIVVADAVERSVVIARTVTEGLTVADSVAGAPVVFVFIADSMSVGDAFTDISIVFNLNLPESLVMAQGFATNIEGFFDQTGSEGITIGDGVVLVLESVASMSEIMTLQDQISADQGTGRAAPEQMAVSDSLLMIVLRPPPAPPAAVVTMPNLMITETEDVDEFEGLTEPTQAVVINGGWDIENLDEDTLEGLLESMNMPVYDVSEEADSGDIGELTMVLPTFWVSMEGDWEDDAGFLTPILSDLPAGMQVMVPVNVKASMEGDEKLGMLGNMTVNFTTAESAGNFVMLITILDDNPESDVSEDPPNDIPAFFIDVTIVGDFPGRTPDTEAFFEDPPEITFTLTKEWAIEQAAEMDGNNVPIIGLFLLDESNGEWLELTAEVEPPTSEVDGTYTYTATLPHFSTYVITAGATAGSGDAGASEGEDGSGGSRLTVVKYLTESLLVTVLVDDGSEGVVRDLVDSFTVLDQQSPLHERVITVQNVTVSVSVVDVRPAAFGAAKATLEFEIVNKNGATEEIVLRYFYSNPATGQVLYGSEQTVMVGSRESVVHTVEIPFSSNGVFDVMIEAESDDGTIASTDVLIDIPWLEVYVYVLAVVIIGAVAAPAVFVAYALRQTVVPLVPGRKQEGVAWAIMHGLIHAAAAAGWLVARALRRAPGRRQEGAIRYHPGGIVRRRAATFYAAARRATKSSRYIAGAPKRAFKFIFRRQA